MPAKQPATTGLPLVDGLSKISDPTLADYIQAASQYVLGARKITDGQRKAGQIRLSTALGRTVLRELKSRLPSMGATAVAGEHPVSGALRVSKVDVSEMDALDGLRLAVEIKPVNLAVGRAIWNRFGDIRTTAVNVHLKFPFAVVGGILTVPTYEVTPRGRKKSTLQLIARAIDRLERAGGRRTEGDAAHLLEGVAVVVYDPDNPGLQGTIPPATSAVRWENFLGSTAATYNARFGTASLEVAAEEAEGPDEAEK